MQAKHNNSLDTNKSHMKEKKEKKKSNHGLKMSGFILNS
jgi:hypothetical protein